MVTGGPTDMYMQTVVTCGLLCWYLPSLIVRVKYLNMESIGGIVSDLNFQWRNISTIGRLTYRIICVAIIYMYM